MVARTTEPPPHIPVDMVLPLNKAAMVLPLNRAAMVLPLIREVDMVLLPSKVTPPLLLSLVADLPCLPLPMAYALALSGTSLLRILRNCHSALEIFLPLSNKAAIGGLQSFMVELVSSLLTMYN
jgi:hypothetical protein